MEPLGLRKPVVFDFDAAVAKTTEALQAEGFGILTEIDVQQTLKKKLDVAFRRYRILGACHPPSAHAALSQTLEAGLMMPCNVVLWEGDDGRVVVEAVDPARTMVAEGHPELAPVAQSVRERLLRVLARLG